jgi:hypothetical protein
VVATILISKSISSRIHDEALGSHFFDSDGENVSVTPLVSRFRPDLGFHPSGEPMSSPAPWGALGESGGNKSAGNVEKSSCTPDGPDLSARKAGRRPHRIVFRAL